MPRVKEQTVYQFDELSDRAKDKARDWFRQSIEHEDYADCVIEDAARMGDLLGINIRTRPVKLMGGGTRQEPSVYWSLDRESFASVQGSYSYRKGSVRAIKAEAPKDSDLHAIALILQSVQRRYFYSVSASLSHGRDNQNVEVDSDRGRMTAEDCEIVSDALRDFASWIHSQLSKEYEYRTSDEAVDEDIRANEYEFDEDGDRS